MAGRVALSTSVEDLARRYPEAVGFLTRHGVRCVRCGEPLWDSLEELLREDGISDPDSLVAELNEFLRITYNKKRGHRVKRPKGGRP